MGKGESSTVATAAIKTKVRKSKKELAPSPAKKTKGKSAEKAKKLKKKSAHVSFESELEETFDGAGFGEEEEDVFEVSSGNERVACSVADELMMARAR